MRHLRLPALRRALSSLPGRYLLGAVLLLGVLAGSAGVVSAYLSHEREVRSRNLRERREALSHLQIIRSALWTAEHNLQAYSLTPDRTYRDQALRAISNGRVQAMQLAGLPWTERNGQAQRARDVAAKFARLEEAARELIATRNDPDRLYPALKLMRDPLEPTNRNFLELFVLS